MNRIGCRVRNESAWIMRMLVILAICQGLTGVANAQESTRTLTHSAELPGAAGPGGEGLGASLPYNEFSADGFALAVVEPIVTRDGKHILPIRVVEVFRGDLMAGTEFRPEDELQVRFECTIRVELGMLSELYPPGSVLALYLKQHAEGRWVIAQMVKYLDADVVRSMFTTYVAIENAPQADDPDARFRELLTWPKDDPLYGAWNEGAFKALQAWPHSAARPAIREAWHGVVAAQAQTENWPVFSRAVQMVYLIQQLRDVEMMDEVVQFATDSPMGLRWPFIDVANRFYKEVDATMQAQMLEKLEALVPEYETWHAEAKARKDPYGTLHREMQTLQQLVAELKEGNSADR
ncbi:MAG: hypothetical protein ACR2NP_08790 [Pirellulaceae bacterium]